MSKTFISGLCLLLASALNAQTISYEISFDNAMHLEARISAKFPGLKNDTVAFRISRTSPGRYGLQEFDKNVYDVTATDKKGKPLSISRPDPYRWIVSGHDGTYLQIDKTHAHLNILAPFIYAPALHQRKIAMNFKVREDLNWKVVTQLPLVSDTTYTAPNLYYFMDRPVSISDYSLREFDVAPNEKKQHVHFVLHHNGTDQLGYKVENRGEIPKGMVGKSFTRRT